MSPSTWLFQNLRKSYANFPKATNCANPASLTNIKVGSIVNSSQCCTNDLGSALDGVYQSKQRQPQTLDNGVTTSMLSSQGATDTTRTHLPHLSLVSQAPSNLPAQSMLRSTQQASKTHTWATNSLLSPTFNLSKMASLRALQLAVLPQLMTLAILQRPASLTSATKSSCTC